MDRQQMISYLAKVAGPVLDTALEERFHQVPIEEREGTQRQDCSRFEAVGRLICGIAPWLASASETQEEEKLKEEYRIKARKLILNQFDEASPDHTDFENKLLEQPQFLVDLAFLAEGMLRAPDELIYAMPKDAMDHLIEIMIRSRGIRPYECNWLLFSAMVEALIYKWTGTYDENPVRYAFSRMREWYKGDGLYGDGPRFAADYYNSYVIQPMMVELAEIFPECLEEGEAAQILMRARRYAALQERMIAPDGSFFAVGRSITYRCGAFHHLAFCALRDMLPEELISGAVRSALSAVMERTLTDASFRPDGFLNIGLSAHQPLLGEDYISTGSLYLCLAAFLPLGLASEHAFFRQSEQPWTQKRLWEGSNEMRDHAIS